MMNHHHRSVYLFITSTDLPVWSELKTMATLYQKTPEQFHLLLTEPRINEFNGAIGHQTAERTIAAPTTSTSTPRLLWLEISPSRLVMTMQGNGKFSYRHFWERGIYGLSRYWLQGNAVEPNHQLQLRNFTRHLRLDGCPLPRFLQLEYELWAGNLQLGCYVLQLEIDH
jgi:hypothetical protein